MAFNRQGEGRVEFLGSMNKALAVDNQATFEHRERVS